VREIALRPRHEERHVGPIGVAAFVLAPRELPVSLGNADGGLLCFAIVIANAQVFRAQQSEDTARRHCCHVAALLIQPQRIARIG
jgi:hypothetical protein